jgi:hypothetical protein
MSLSAAFVIPNAVQDDEGKYANGVKLLTYGLV